MSQEMLKQFPSNLNVKWCICKAENQYVNLVEIGLVLAIWKAEFGNFMVPVNNKLVCCASFVFLAADT